MLKIKLIILLLVFSLKLFSQVEIEDKELISKIENQKLGNGVVEFYSTSCSYCGDMKSIFQSVATKHKNQLNFYKIDINTSNTDFGLEGTPTYVFFRNGKISQIVSGTITADEFDLLLTNKSIDNSVKDCIGYKYYPVDFVYNSNTNEMTLNSKHLDRSKCKPEARHYSSSKNHFCCELPKHSEYLAKTLNEIDIRTSNNYYECNKKGIWNTDVITTKYSDKSIDVTTIIKKEEKIEFNSMNTLNGRILKKTKCSTGSIDSNLYKEKVRTTPGSFKCTYFNEKLCTLVKENSKNNSDADKLEIKKYLESKEFINEEKINYQKSYLETLYSLANRHRDFNYLENLGSSYLYTERYHISMRKYIENALLDDTYEYAFEALCERINTPKKSSFNLSEYME